MYTIAIILALICPDPVAQEYSHQGGGTAHAAASSSAAGGALGVPVQLTFGDQFVKAGESYISPDGAKVIFQAVEVPAEGEEPEEIYAMYLGDLHHQNGSWRMDNIRKLTPDGSANTCGWFHPTDPRKVIFASTVTEPGGGDVPGLPAGKRQVQMVLSATNANRGNPY